MAADDNNNNNGSLDLSSFKEQFDKILLSKFAPYKKPRNNYHHLINCFAVILEKKRGGDATCDLEVKWKDLKRREFPQEEVQGLIKKAYKRVTNQPKIFTFFTSNNEGQSSATSEIAGPSVTSDVVPTTEIG